MRRAVVVVALALSSVALAQGHPGEDLRAAADAGTAPRPSEEALFGTPQKPEARPADGGVASTGNGDAGTGAFVGEPDRPSEDELFGTSGGQTPEPGGTSERPSEDAMFGASEETRHTGTEPPAAAAAEEQRQEFDEEAERLRGGAVNRFATGEMAEDTLAIGGLFYSQLIATNREGNALSRTTLSAPTLVDAYFDARPNDRVRAMVTARMRYESFFSEAAAAQSFLGRTPDNPSVALDQLWLRFDILRQVFVTAGRQHIKWGTGRFWNPTDFLHPVRRDPLALFDVRTGTNLVKFHLPFESTGANLYAVAAFEDLSPAPQPLLPLGTRPAGSIEEQLSATVGSMGGALRGEFVLGDAEFGVDAIFQRTHTPAYGADISAALGPIDVYGEVAVRTGPYHRWRLAPGPLDGPGQPVRERAGSTTYAATVGANYTFAYRENDTLTVGAETFFNPSGYDDPDLYSTLIFAGEFQPFYLGQNYAAVYVLAPGPFSWDNTNLVLSNLANLTDRSFVTRFDFTTRVLTHLSVEANASVFYGEESGEFRSRLEIPEFTTLDSSGRPSTIPAFTLPAQRFSVGLGLRVDM